ncbi:MAG: molybdopterin cofactor-binding domain-containing protein [Caldilineaceae bacterium]
MVAPLIGLPVRRIRVVKPRIGGGFGGKQEMLIEDLCAHLTLATGRPVKFEYTRPGIYVGAYVTRRFCASAAASTRTANWWAWIVRSPLTPAYGAWPHRADGHRFSGAEHLLAARRPLRLRRGLHQQTCSRRFGATRRSSSAWNSTWKNWPWRVDSTPSSSSGPNWIKWARICPWPKQWAKGREGFAQRG